MRARHLALGIGALVGAYAVIVRPRILSFGATDEEVTRAFPGDELISAPTSSSTMAVTIDAPPEEVWPWLVQMGYGRAGWYSYDSIDHGSRPSADRIVRELQLLELGDRVPSSASGSTWFTVEAFDPEHALVFRGTFALRSRCSFDATWGLPWLSADGTWAFVLDPEEGFRTRLVVRSRGTGRPRLVARLLDLFVGQPGHFVMQRKQLAELKRRAEQARETAPV